MRQKVLNVLINILTPLPQPLFLLLKNERKNQDTKSTIPNVPVTQGKHVC